MPQRLWATGDERTSIWRLWKTRVRQAGGGSGAPYVIPVKLLAHETQTIMAMCLSAGEKTTMAKCLSANTNNNGTVFICSREIWSRLQRKLANCNKVKVFSTTSRSWEKWYKPIRSCVSYHVPLAQHFLVFVSCCNKRPLCIYSPHRKQRLCLWLMALMIDTKQIWFDLMSMVDVIWLGLSRCYWMIYYCCFGPLESACEISHLTPSENPLKKWVGPWINFKCQ